MDRQTVSPPLVQIKVLMFKNYESFTFLITRAVIMERILSITPSGNRINCVLTTYLNNIAIHDVAL